MAILTYAQAEQDLWALQQFPQGFRGYAVDVGAYDGTTRSNTFLLERLGWTVLCMEPNPELIKKLKTNRAFVEPSACDTESGSGKLKIHLNNMEAYTSLRPRSHERWHPEPDAKWMSIEVPVLSLNDALEKWEFPRLDFLSVDVEGTELDVLKGIDLDRWSPHAITAECWDIGEGELDRYLKASGYEKVGRLMVDNLYLKETE